MLLSFAIQTLSRNPLRMRVSGHRNFQLQIHVGVLEEKGNQSGLSSRLDVLVPWNLILTQLLPLTIMTMRFGILHLIQQGVPAKAIQLHAIGADALVQLE